MEGKICKTIQALLQNTCTEVEATTKSLNAAVEKYSAQLENRFVKVINDFTSGAYVGALIVEVSQSHTKANVLAWLFDEQKLTFPNYSKAEGALMIVSVAICFRQRKGSYDEITHGTIIIVDSEHRTIEYSDPHGHTTWNPAVYSALQAPMENAFSGYKFLPPWETCPEKGIQAVLNEGYCVLFSTLYAFLRLRCPKISPLDLQSYLVSLGRQSLLEIIAGWFCVLLS